MAVVRRKGLQWRLPLASYHVRKLSKPGFAICLFWDPKLDYS